MLIKFVIAMGGRPRIDFWGTQNGRETPKMLTKSVTNAKRPQRPGFHSDATPSAKAGHYSSGAVESGEVVPPRPSLEAADGELSICELNSLNKFLNTMGDSPQEVDPRLITWDAWTRGQQLTMGQSASQNQLKSTKQVFVDWVTRCNQAADEQCKAWLHTPIMTRGSTRDRPRLSRRLEPAQDWLLLTVLERIIDAMICGRVFEHYITISPR